MYSRSGSSLYHIVCKAAWFPLLGGVTPHIRGVFDDPFRAWEGRRVSLMRHGGHRWKPEFPVTKTTPYTSLEDPHSHRGGPGGRIDPGRRSASATTDGHGDRGQTQSEVLKTRAPDWQSEALLTSPGGDTTGTVKVPRYTQHAPKRTRYFTTRRGLDSNA